MSPPTAFGQGVELERLAANDTLDLCIASVRSSRGARGGAVASRAEIGVQVGGELWQRGHRGGAHRYGPGTVHLLSKGEAYAMRYRAENDHVQIVWFSLDVDRLFGVDEDRDLWFTDGRPLTDPVLLDVARDVLRARQAGRDVDPNWHRAVVERARPLLALSRRSAVVRVRRELEAHPERELYLEHLAELAEMHPSSLVRAFRRRYGVSPVQFRTRTRLNAASRAAWAEPERPVRDIADEHGFSNLSYFYRQFGRYFGTTPARHRRNVVDGRRVAF